MKLLTRFIARDQRSRLVELEKELDNLTKLVDDFYALLGPRLWIFHDHLSITEVGDLIQLDADAAEEALIAIYRDHETLDRLIRLLNRFPALRVRMDLIEKARVDYEKGRFYSTVLVLITVMDGFVNDLEPARRRGLHTREADELAAWDSVVGHHMGLTNAHNTFTKGTYKTSSEPLYELERHGIIHGTQLSYDNVVVATKAWNRLFAVADWAASRERQAVEPKPSPSWREVLAQISRNEKATKALDAWQPSILNAGDRGFEDHEIFSRATRYLDGWTRKNYGAMADVLSPRVAESSHAQTAGMIRSECEMYRLKSFEVKRLAFEAAAVCEIDVDLTFESETRPARMRCIREAADGDSAMPNEDGEWYLFLWGPLSMLNRAD